MDADDHDPSRPPVLVLTRDAGLREHLLRLAAAAGSAVAAPAEPGAALRGWAGAGLVLVGTDAAPELVSLSPARRAAVHLVTWPPVPDDAYRDALALGAEDVLDLPRCDAWVGDLVADAAEPPGGADPPTGHGAAGAPGRAGVGAADGPGVVVGVVGGSGGAGVTTLVAALGQVGSGRGRTLLVDLDPHGPGLDRVVGLDDRPGVGWDDLDRSAGRLGARALREAVPRQGDLGVLTWRDGARTDVPPPGAARRRRRRPRRRPSGPPAGRGRPRPGGRDRGVTCWRAWTGCWWWPDRAWRPLPRRSGWSTPSAVGLRRCWWSGGTPWPPGGWNGPPACRCC